MKYSVIQYQDFIVFLVHTVVGETQIAVFCGQDKRTGMDPVADGIAPAQLISVRGIIAKPNITERAVSAVVVTTKFI